MIELTVESYLGERVAATGGVVRKIAWPGRRGAPDRLCGWPNGRHGLVEVKRPGGKPEAHQLREHNRLRAIGLPVEVIDTIEGVDAYVARMAA